MQLISKLLILVLSLTLASSFPSATAEEPASPPESATDGMLRLVQDLGDTDPRLRARAIQLLSDGVEDAAIQLTRDREDNVALAATGVLLESRNQKAEEAIREVLSSKDRSASFKAQVISTISDRKDTRFIPETGALLSERNPALRRTVLLALQAFSTPECLPYFMTATTDGDLQVSTTAVAGLARLGDPAALPRVGLLLGSEEERLVAAAASAIPALGGTEQYAKQLTALLESGPAGASRGLLVALQYHPSPGAIPILAKAAASADPSVRILVARALESNTAPAAEDMLLSLMADADERVRSAAVQSLADRGTAARMPDVIAMAGDDSSQVRAAVAIALGTIGSSDGLAALKGLLADKDLSVKLAAVAAAGRIGGDSALPLLKSAATDPDPYMRMEAVRGLASQNSAPATEVIRRLAGDKDLAVRVTAITELGRLRDTESEELLKAARGDDAEAVRNAARTALAMLKE